MRRNREAALRGAQAVVVYYASAPASLSITAIRLISLRHPGPSPAL
ncbi:hypothetical protein [Streptomyces sp. NPDC048659]